jgi:methylmalonyl-CoA/ethylmalonyl-CoA epimerase
VPVDTELLRKAHRDQGRVQAVLERERHAEVRRQAQRRDQLRASNLRAALRRLDAAGVRLIDAEPRTGTHGWQIAFIHPESCHGVLTELVEA